MILVNLMGGLGNQMFQYACGQALADATGQEVRYATDSLATFAQARALELQMVFGINLPLAGPGDMSHLVGGWCRKPWARRMLARTAARPLRGRRFIAEQRFMLIPDLTDRAASGAYLHGYWQSEQNFSAHAAAIRLAFQFHGDPGQQNMYVMDRLTAEPSIGIHIRRGDYVTNSKATAAHGLLPATYYISAVEELRATCPEARVFVFSDDPTWVETNILQALGNAESITHNFGANSYRDMQLMTQCDALVIANSSFSWWAGWLNDRPGKSVIAPLQWFNDLGLDGSAIVPSNWLRR